jgi:hypothetical protein
VVTHPPRFVADDVRPDPRPAPRDDDPPPF